ncbi:MAG: diguanylate cyclase [Candidatus Binatia bacterium]
MPLTEDKARFTVLVIEDHPDQRELLELVLQREGYRVISAANGAEALEKLEKEPVQLALSDIMMPKMDGLELLHRIRSNQAFKNIYLILITARIQEGDRVRGLDLGADDYINKPFSFTELLARVRVGARVVQYQQHLEYQTLIDPLTGLFNRRAFEKKIEEEFDRIKRYHHPVSLLMLDIDNFKMINDTYGHHGGDTALKKIAGKLSLKTRRSDYPARYGGEEFVLILPETDLESALQVGEKIKNDIKSSTFGTTTRPFSLTVSIGISSNTRKQYSDWHHMLQDADQALYLAKNNGKDRVEAFLPQNTERLDNGKILEKQLA